MLIVKKILGNIYSDVSLGKKIEDYKTNGKSQKLFLTRAEMEKIHLRNILIRIWMKLHWMM